MSHLLVRIPCVVLGACTTTILPRWTPITHIFSNLPAQNTQQAFQMNAESFSSLQHEMLFPRIGTSFITHGICDIQKEEASKWSKPSTTTTPLGTAIQYIFCGSLYNLAVISL